MKIVKEEVFGLVGVVIVIEDEVGVLISSNYCYWTADLTISIDD